jgi:VWFA-related protein
MKKVIIVAISLALILSLSCKKESDDCYSLKSYGKGVDAAARKVKLLFQVLDKSQNGVPNLKNTDFEVYENDQPISIEASASFDPQQIPFSIRTTMLFDISSSVQSSIQQIKDAGNLLIDKKLASQKIAIYVFDKNTRMLLNYTSDATALKAAINSIPSTNLESSTNLYGAVIDVCKTLTTHFGIDSIVDGNVLMFTDGRHNADPSLTVDQARAAVVKANANIFIAALKSPDLDEGSLNSIVSASNNGKYFLAADISKLNDVFTSVQKRISDLANSLYFLTYKSPITNPTARDNSLRVGVKGHCGNVTTTFNSQGFQK